MPTAPRTVLGDPVVPDAYDLVLAHEHLLIDITCWLDEAHPAYERLRGVHVDDDTIDLVRSHPFACPDNLVLDSTDVAVDELSAGPDRPRMLVVDVTPDTVGCDPERLAQISERSGVDVVRGCGPYIEKSWHGLDLTADEVTARVRSAFCARRPAAVIGEIGTSSPITSGERRALTGAARAQAELAAPLYVHVDPWSPEAHEALDIVEKAGGDLSRTVICHMDIVATRNPEYVFGVLSRGAWVAIDIWGDEDDYGGDPMPLDTERLSAVLRLMERGWGSRLVHSQDVCTKSQLSRFGGPGYLHLWRTVRPLLASAGLDERDLADQMAGNALRLLTHDELNVPRPAPRVGSPI